MKFECGNEPTFCFWNTTRAKTKYMNFALEYNILSLGPVFSNKKGVENEVGALDSVEAKPHCQNVSWKPRIGQKAQKLKTFPQNSSGFKGWSHSIVLQ